MRNQLDDSAEGQIGISNDGTPDWIAVGNAPIILGRSRTATVRLLDSTISRHHATLTRFENAIYIEDHDSSHGTFVNGNRIRKLLAQPGDRVRFGDQITYRVQGEGLSREQVTTGMSLAVDGLAVIREDKWIVQDINFLIAPDSFVGILGPSGAGKSTILNSLATFLSPGQGRIVFDEQYDITVNQDNFRATMGHVPQDDAIFNTLTVRENLTFASLLRLDVAQQEKSLLNVEVNRVVELVGLTGHADKLSVVLSGGQRKRLSVAIELLRRPRLLLLDEPTSGLDPGTEARLMEYLRQISRQGTTVACTTHLMYNLGLFDAVVVLGVLNGIGQVAYCGPPDNLLKHFGCAGFADLYDKLETGQFEVFRNPNAESDSSNTHISTGELIKNSHVQPARKPESCVPPVVSSEQRTISQLVNLSLGADVGRQCASLCKRGGLLIGRDHRLLWTMLAQPLFLGLLICLTQYDASHVTSLLFFSIVVAIWMGLNNSIRDLVRERKLYIRDRLAGLQPGAYLFSKLVVHTAVGAAQLILLIAIVRLCATRLFAEPVADDLRAVSLFWLFCVLITCYVGALGLGLLISALVNTEETAVAFLPLLIMPQLLMSAVGTSQVEDVYHRPQEIQPFRPLLVKIRSQDSLPATAACIDVLSLTCFSRPAILLAAQPTVPREFGTWFWLADLCHLIVLVMATWTLTFAVFHWAEQRWARLIGVG